MKLLDPPRYYVEATGFYVVADESESCLPPDRVARVEQAASGDHERVGIVMNKVMSMASVPCRILATEDRRAWWLVNAEYFDLALDDTRVRTVVAAVEDRPEQYQHQVTAIFGLDGNDNIVSFVMPIAVKSLFSTMNHDTPTVYVPKTTAEVLEIIKAVGQ